MVFTVLFHSFSALAAELDSVVSERLQQGHGRGRGAASREPAAPAQPRPQLVPASHR